jgi:hypothetical protein
MTVTYVSQWCYAAAMTTVGGIDPGPRPGLVILHLEDQRIVRLERGAHLSWRTVVECSDYVAVERYVRGGRSARMADGAAQHATELMARQVCAAVTEAGKVLQALPAGAVKPWADDERLRAYAVETATGVVAHWPTVYAETRGGGGHDRDAARHALNLAVKLNLLPKR